MKKTFSPRYRWGIFAICAFMYILSQFWRVSTAVIAGDLSRDLGISPEMLGLLGGAFFYSFALAQLPMGPLLDRLGPRILISLLGCIGAASVLLFALSGSVSLMILARTGIGIGMAAVLMGSYKIFTTWFSPHEFATLAGLMISIGSLGAICATTPLALLSETFGWRVSFIFMGAMTLLATGLIYLFVKDRPTHQTGMPSPDPPTLAGIFSGLRTVFGSSRFWRLAPLAFASYGTLIVVQGLWGGPYLMHTYGMSKTAAGSILFAIPVGVICGAPLWGRWSDKIRRRKLPILSVQIAMLLIFFSLILNPQLPRWGLVLQFWLLGLTYSSNTILYAQVKETFSLSIAGTALTALNFFVMLGAAVIQHVVGLIMSNWQPSITGVLPVAAFQWGFGFSAILLSLALVIYCSSRDTKHETASS